MDRNDKQETSIDLIHRARKGERSAQDELVQRYLPLLRRWASGRIPAWARGLVDTDDVVQETMIATLRNIETFEPRGDGALHAYLRQALRTRVLDEVRNAGRRPQVQELTPGYEAREPSPLAEAIGAEMLERYETALERLDESDREAIVSRVELGLGYTQLAAQLGKPSADAARMAVSRALVRLAREMGHER